MAEPKFDFSSVEDYPPDPHSVRFAIDQVFSKQGCPQAAYALLRGFAKVLRRHPGQPLESYIAGVLEAVAMSEGIDDSERRARACAQALRVSRPKAGRPDSAASAETALRVAADAERHARKSHNMDPSKSQLDVAAAHVAGFHPRAPRTAREMVAKIPDRVRKAQLALEKTEAGFSRKRSK